MEQFKMVLRHQDLKFLKEDELSKNVVILKEEVIDDTFTGIELMCSSIGEIFVLGQFIGWRDCYDQYKGKVDELSAMLENALQSGKKLMELNKKLTEIIESKKE